MAKKSIEGMTVNERLFHFGLHEKFDAAARSGNVSAMMKVLFRAHFSEAQASQTAQAVASNPQRYGY